MGGSIWLPSHKLYIGRGFNPLLIELNIKKIPSQNNLWYYHIHANVVSFFAASQGNKTLETLIKNLINLNEVFGKNVTYHDIKSN